MWEDTALRHVSRQASGALTEPHFPASPMTDVNIPGYIPVERIDAGGTSELWEATDGGGRKVALKLYSPRLGPAAREALLEALDRAAGLRHQNLVAVLAHGEHEGRIWAAMELVSGATNARVLFKGRRAPASLSLAIARQAALGLAYAHQHGVITRGLSPERILVQGQGRMVKILEPGVAAEAALDTSRTATMADMGGLRYMAPELGRDPVGDAGCDIYSLGVILYEMLTGRVPLGGVRLPSQLNEEVPAAVDPVVMRCTAKAPGERYPDMAALVEAIDEMLADTPSLATSSGRLSMAGAGSGGKGRLAAYLGGGALLVAAIVLLLARGCVG